MPLSLNPNDAEERAVDARERVTVMDAYTEMTDYGGRVDVPAPVLTLEVRTANGFRRKRSYSAGGADYVKCNADNTGFEPVGDSRGMPAGCNAVAFLQSLVGAGFPAAELASGDVTAIVGLELVMIEVEQPRRFEAKPKPKLGPDGKQLVDAKGTKLFEPVAPPKKYWLVSEIVGAEQHLPGLTPGEVERHRAMTNANAQAAQTRLPQGDYSAPVAPPQARTVPRQAPLDDPLPLPQTPEQAAAMQRAQLPQGQQQTFDEDEIPF